MTRICFLLLTAFCLSTSGLKPQASGLQQPDQSGPRHYLYLSDQRILTLEITGANRAILNYINLSENIEVLQSPMLLILDEAGRDYHGHVFEVEDAQDPLKRFTSNDLIKQRQHRGYALLGDYRFQSAPAQALFQVSGRILKLEPISARDFETMATRVGEIDLLAEDSKRAVVMAGFNRGFGEMHFVATPEAQAWERFFPNMDLIPPVALSKPAPVLPASATDLPDPVVVRVSVFVSRSGGIFKPEVVEGINPTLDQLALETVRNSWTFLPAISKGQIADAEVTLNVVFEKP